MNKRNKTRQKQELDDLITDCINITMGLLCLVIVITCIIGVLWTISVTP